MARVERMVTTVLTVADLDASVSFYRDAIGLDLHLDDHAGDDVWTSGRHAAASWSDGAFVHFALYETKGGGTTVGAQVAFRVTDLSEAHDRARAAGARVLHEPHAQPWGRSARYLDPDGNVVELTEPG